MSYIYLAESGAESSAECFSGIPASVLSKSNPTADKSCCKDNATEFCQSSQSGTTCEPLMASLGEEKSTASAEASPAKTSPARARARESTEREADCGLNLQESLARYDHATHLWRTRQCSLFGDSGECLETFPKSGMMQGGVLWELMTLERPTDVSASGYWRTPDTGAGGGDFHRKSRRFCVGENEGVGVRNTNQALRPSETPATMADADRLRQQQSQGSVQDFGRRACDGGFDVSDAEMPRRGGGVIPNSKLFGNGRREQLSQGEQTQGNPSDALSNPNGDGLQIRLKDADKTSNPIGRLYSRWWDRDPADQDGAFESQLGRVADGVADRVDRLKAIGNGQVPLVAATAFRLLKGGAE